MFFVYVIFSPTAKVKYTGFTEDLERRLTEHNSGALGKFTKNKGPWELIYSEKYETKTAALKREKYFKTGVGRDFIKKVTGK
jgi:putative endonuclease